MTLLDLAMNVAARQLDAPRPGRDVIGDLAQPGDAGCDFLTSDNYYSWYYHVGAVLKPRKIVEFGVRYGYSLKALLDGSGVPWENCAVVAVDDERDGVRTLDIFEKYFRDRHIFLLDLWRRDTQTLPVVEFVNTVGVQLDLAHVDAWHTEDGCYHECELAYAAVRPGGFVLVDDALPGGVVRAGADRFCRDRKLDNVYLETLRGMLIFRIPD